MKLNRLNMSLDELAGLKGGDRAARRMIQGALRHTAFKDFLTGAVAGDWPVAAVPQEVLGAIGGRSRILGLSQYTANKQAGRIPGKTGHPDVVAKDYLRVQGILDEGEVFRDANRSRVALGFIEEGGRPWRAVVKATKDQKETYLETFHRSNEKQRRRARRNLRKLGGE